MTVLAGHLLVTDLYRADCHLALKRWIEKGPRSSASASTRPSKVDSCLTFIRRVLPWPTWACSHWNQTAGLDLSVARTGSRWPDNAKWKWVYLVWSVLANSLYIQMSWLPTRPLPVFPLCVCMYVCVHLHVCVVYIDLDCLCVCVWIINETTNRFCLLKTCFTQRQAFLLQLKTYQNKNLKFQNSFKMLCWFHFHFWFLNCSGLDLFDVEKTAKCQSLPACYSWLSLIMFVRYRCRVGTRIGLCGLYMPHLMTQFDSICFRILQFSFKNFFYIMNRNQTY